MVNDASGDENTLLERRGGARLWKEMGTNVSISFPVNDPTSQFILATARRPNGQFAVDALSTDGGGLARNVTIEYGLAIVALGGLSLQRLRAQGVPDASPDARPAAQGPAGRGR